MTYDSDVVHQEHDKMIDEIGNLAAENQRLVKAVKNAISDMRKVLAIEILEYEDKNYLAYDVKRNSEEKQKLLAENINHLEEAMSQ